jgi:hypothetical protein
MTKSRKVINKEKKKRAHQTVHRRVMTDPKVARMVVVLRRRWAGMRPVERGDRLRELTALGCSTRGLENELKQSATSIRRHMVLAKLPDEDRVAIDAGASAKKILEQKSSVERHRRQHERVIEDRKTGGLSDEVVTMMFEFCRAEGRPFRVRVSGEDAEKLFNAVLLSLYNFEGVGHRGVRVSQKLGLKGLWRRTKPGHEKEEIWLSWQAKWLAEAVWAKAPERPIWESAIEKAKRRVGELTVEKRRYESLQDRLRKQEDVLSSTFRRPYKGARSLERQGRPTQSSKLG